MPTSADKRLFEQTDKFWEVWCDKQTVFTRFGKTGSKGQTRLKKEPSPDAAMKTLEQMVKDKIKEGYQQTGGELVTDSNIKPLDPKALKKQLSTLNDDAAHLVFADWLTEQGHPWGELITLQHNAATAANDKKKEQFTKNAAKILKEHGTTLVGRLAQQKYAKLDWHLGLLKRATVETGVEFKGIVSAVKELMAQPAAQKLEGVGICPVPATFKTLRDWDSSDENLQSVWPNDLGPLASVLPADKITHVGFGGWPAPAASAYVQMPTFTAISKAFPKLKSLSITGYFPDKAGKLSLSNLTELAVRYSTATQDGLRAVYTSKLPKLERLTIWLGGNSSCILDDVYEPDEYDEDDEDGDRYPANFKGTDLEKMECYSLESGVGDTAITELLGALPKTVKHLALSGGNISEPILTVIMGHKVLKQLETLDMSGGNLNDESVKTIVKAKKALEHLKTFDISDNRITAEGVKKLSAFKNLKADNQRERGNPEFFMRYVATME
jgi:uncharacterized protein (TIGR02996 family)